MACEFENMNKEAFHRTGQKFHLPLKSPLTPGHFVLLMVSGFKGRT